MYKKFDKDEIYKELEFEIQSLKLCPNHKLSESYLTKRYGISRSPSKSILQRLNTNGYVKIYPQIGTFVSKIDIDVLKHNIYVRSLVEVAVYSEFLDVCTDKNIIKLENILEKQTKIANSNSSKRDFDFIMSDNEFHSYIYGVVGKKYIWENFIDTRLNYHRYRLLDTITYDDKISVINFHGKILDAIKKKDESLPELVKKHIYFGLESKSEVLEKFESYFENN